MSSFLAFWPYIASGSDSKPRYVWLVPYFVDDPTKAIKGITITGCSSDVEEENDLRGGWYHVGGRLGHNEHYPHCLAFDYSRNLPPITTVALWRSRGAVGKPPSGYSGISSDLNKGRGGNYLYLVWTSAKA